MATKKNDSADKKPAAKKAAAAPAKAKGGKVTSPTLDKAAQKMADAEAKRKEKEAAKAEAAAAKQKVADEKAAAKKALEEASKSPFGPKPEKKKAGPPFEFDGNNHCTNPETRFILSHGVEIILSAAERGGSWSSSHRVDVPAIGKAAAVSYGAAFPMCAPDNKSFGFASLAIAMYEAGRDALNTIKAHAMPHVGGKEARTVLDEADFAVSKLQPANAKRLAEETAIVGYDSSKAGDYLSTFNAYGIAHHSGILFKEDMDEAAFTNFGLAIEHFDQKSRWVRADWVAKGKKDFPKLVEKLIGDAAAQTIWNDVSVAKAFPHDERRANLSFSHHAEVAPLTKAQRAKWLDKAEEDGLSVSKLRKAIQEAKNPTGGGTDATGGAGATDAGTGAAAGGTTDGTQNAAGGSEGDAGGGNTSGASGDAGGASTGQGGASTGQGGAAGEEDEFASGGTEATPKEKAFKEWETAMERLDAVETYIRNGGHKSPELSEDQRRDVRKQIAKLLDLANK